MPEQIKPTELIQVDNPQPQHVEFVSFPMPNRDDEIGILLDYGIDANSVDIVQSAFKRIDRVSRQEKVDSHKKLKDEEHLRKTSDHIAETDSVTFLLNKRGIMNKLEEILDSPDLDPNRYIVMFMDLDGFKGLNDNFGHKEGDRILRHFGQRLKLRKSDVAGRIGGDEFILIIDMEAESNAVNNEEVEEHREPKTREEVVEGLSKKIRKQLYEAGDDARKEWEEFTSGESNLHDPESYKVDASIGVAEINGYRTAEKILSIADSEMYKNKRQRKAKIS